MTSAPTYGWYGDDFTGATDTLATLAQSGQRAMLFLDAPTPAQLESAGPLDAIGIAGTARAMDPAAMEKSLTPVGRFFAQAGVRVLHYKCCSTFDSAPRIGNIATAGTILKRFFPNPFTPIVGGQPSIGRYCLFSTLFAAAGAGGSVYRIDRHPTMAAHPVTPMTEADLRRHFAALGWSKVLGVHLPVYAQDDAALQPRIDKYLGERPDAFLFDVAEQEHLAPLGRLIESYARWAPMLTIGASSVAQALFPQIKPSTRRLTPATGPVLIVVGSLSPVTRTQMAAATSFEQVTVDAARLGNDTSFSAALLNDVVARLRAGKHVLVATSEPADRAALTTHARVAAATATFTADVLRQVRLHRLGVAGGDTSSQAIKAMAPWGLSHQATPAPGVALCRAHSDDPALDGLEVMLKGGQMGPDDLFEQIVHGPAGTGSN